MSKRPNHDEPVDVLAAEEFPVGDAAAHEPGEAEEPHDVLAADEFAVPAPDPALHGQHEHEHEHDHGDVHPLRIGPVEVPSQIARAGAAIAAALLILLRLRRRRRRRAAQSD